jgi:hypothetical protein
MPVSRHLHERTIGSHAQQPVTRPAIGIFKTRREAPAQPAKARRFPMTSQEQLQLQVEVLGNDAPKAS